MMTKLSVRDAKTWRRLSGRLVLVFGLAAAVFAYGATQAHAGGKTRFSNTDSLVQIAALPSHGRIVGAADLARERAKGIGPETLSAPGGESKVAVILWDDAWSELQRRAHSAGAAPAAGSNAGTSIAGSSGASSN